MAGSSLPSGPPPHPPAYPYSNSHSKRKSTDSSRSSQSTLSTSTSPTEPTNPSYSRSAHSYDSTEASSYAEPGLDNQSTLGEAERRRNVEAETSLRKRDYAVRISRLMGDQLVKGINRGWRIEKREEERREADRSRRKGTPRS